MLENAKYNYQNTNFKSGEREEKIYDKKLQTPKAGAQQLRQYLL